MRSAIVALSVLLASSAQAAEVHVVSPPLVRDGLTELAAAYTRQTGIVVTVTADVMGKILGDIRSGTPAADVVMLPPDMMDALARDGGVKNGTREKLGRVEIALAVRAGAPHPDISTVEKLRAALLGARMVVYTRPGPPRNSMEAGIIDRLLHRPDFSGIHTMTIATGSGIAGLARGDGDMAMQVVPEVRAQPGVELVGPLPAELGAHIDTETAVSARSADPAAAEAFIRYVTGPGAAAIWKENGLDR